MTGWPGSESANFMDDAHQELIHADRDLDEAMRLRWVACDYCGGSGEVEVRPIVGPYADPTPHGELCSACDGTGRHCVEVFPVERDDDQPHN